MQRKGYTPSKKKNQVVYNAQDKYQSFEKKRPRRRRFSKTTSGNVNSSDHSLFNASSRTDVVKSDKAENICENQTEDSNDDELNDISILKYFQIFRPSSSLLMVKDQSKVDMMTQIIQLATICADHQSHDPHTNSVGNQPSLELENSVDYGAVISSSKSYDMNTIQIIGLGIRLKELVLSS